MSRKRLMQEMDAGEVLQWMAYEMSTDPDNHKRYMAEIAEEAAAKMTAEERAEILKQNIMKAFG